MRCLSIFILLIFQSIIVTASASTLISPDQFFNKKIGEQHLRYDQIEQYLNYLAQNNAKIKRMPYGMSHEGRGLNLTLVSSKQNIDQLDAIRIRHEQLNNPFATPLNTQTMPAIIWLSFSAHGNEPSGTHAAIKAIYQLINSQDASIQSWLDNTVILFDTIANPDGYDAFATWANRNYSLYPPADRQDASHNEPWPSARGNHYYFDLNRDWLPLSQIESQAKIRQYHEWKPNLLADFHEMQSDHSYFFQPGVPDRTNPLTPNENIELTRALTQFTVEQFDKEDKLYFSEERFDDFYIGKASTYPDIQGGIGILLEQAGSLGQVIETQFGELSFAKTIENQLSGIFSIIRAANAKRIDLLNYQQNFFKQSIEQAKSDKFSGYLIKESAHSNQLRPFLTLLDFHQIKAYRLTSDYKIDDQLYPKETSFWIPFNQAQYKLIKSIFSEQTEFNDSVFYDVTNWNMALAYGIKYAAVGRNIFGVKVADNQWKTAEQIVSKTSGNMLDSANAWAINTHSLDSNKLLSQLLKKGLTVRVAEKSISVLTDQGEHALPPGSLIILKAENTESLRQELNQLLSQHSSEFYNITSLKTPKGPDLGSAFQVKLTQPKAAILVGDSVSHFEVGEIWHHFDSQLALPLNKLNISNATTLELTNYTHLILTSGDYTSLPKSFLTQLKLWLKQGGTLITLKRATLWASQKGLIANDFLSQRDMELAFASDDYSYQEQEHYLAQRMISGTAFKTKLDLSHPIAIGMKDNQLTVFQNDRVMLLQAGTPFHDIAVFEKSPLLAGYTSYANQKLISDTTALTAYKLGKGQVIAFTFNPLFRGYWFNTAKLFDNSIFFSHLINFSH